MEILSRFARSLRELFVRSRDRVLEACIRKYRISQDAALQHAARSLFMMAVTW